MVKRRFFTFYAAKVQQKMHICKNFAQKFTFECKIFANGLHNATVLSGECAFAQAASEGTTVSLFAGAKPSNGLHNATVLSGECAFAPLSFTSAFT